MTYAKSIRFSKTCDFADGTSIIQCNSLLDRLSKQVNKDLSNLSNWLRANKLSLNVKKTELVIFRPSYFSTHSVKYLGVLTDEHLLWNKQVAQIKMRLNRAIGMLSKLRINANFHILKTAYHSLFESHLQYGTQLWGQKNNEIITTFQKLQNRALKKITVKKRHDRISCV